MILFCRVMMMSLMLAFKVQPDTRLRASGKLMGLTPEYSTGPGLKTSPKTLTTFWRKFFTFTPT